MAKDPMRGVFSQTIGSGFVERSLIDVYAIIPAELRPKIWGKMLPTLRKSGDAVAAQLQRTVQTWEEHDITFKREIHFSGSGDANVQIFPTGDQKSVDIWNYLNGGTDMRWSVVSKDWESKTWPLRIVAQAGAGHVVMRGRAKMQAAGMNAGHGIEARNWTRHRKIIGAGTKVLTQGIYDMLREYTDKDIWAKGRQKVVTLYGTESLVRI